MSVKNWIKARIPSSLRFWAMDIINLTKGNECRERVFHKNRVMMYKRFVRPGNLVFDVGANMGNRVKPLLTIGARVVAIEPQEECSKYLRYKFGGKITVVSKGLGSEPGVKQMFISPFHQVSSFSEEWIESVKSQRFAGISWPTQKQVEITTLDLLIAKYGKPEFIKIDVEGYELEVIKGLSEPIKYLSFEYTVPEGLAQLEKVLTELNKISGSCVFNYSIGETMNLELSDWLLLETFREELHSNRFCKSEFGDVYVRMKD